MDGKIITFNAYLKCCGMVVVDYISIQLATTIVEADKGE